LLFSIGSTFIDWASDYGPVITLRQGSEVAIVIARVDVRQNFTSNRFQYQQPFTPICSCLQAATEIMEKEGSALADRPPMIAADELLSGGKRISLIGSGERFRRLRKAIHTHFQVKALEMYNGIQSDQAKTLILDILDDPRNHQKHAHRYVSVHTMCEVCVGLAYVTDIPHLSSCVLHMASRAPRLSMIQTLLR
jgi:hypothetical protein